MNTQNFSEKRKYTHPEMIAIVLDKEISLALESYPAIGPGEDFVELQQQINSVPLKTTIL